MGFQDLSLWNISVSSLVILTASVFEISYGQTDRQTRAKTEPPWVTAVDVAYDMVIFVANWTQTHQQQSTWLTPVVQSTTALNLSVNTNNRWFCICVEGDSRLFYLSRQIFRIEWKTCGEFLLLRWSQMCAVVGERDCICLLKVSRGR